MDDSDDRSPDADREETEPDGADGTATLVAESSANAVEADAVADDALPADVDGTAVQDPDGAGVQDPDGAGVQDPDGAAGHSDRLPALGEIPIAFPERDPGDLDDATELLLMDQYAHPDDTVTVQILGWDREGEVVAVDYALPTGERVRDRYRWPTPGQYADSDFLAIVRGLGYAPSTADHVVGEFARARQENGQWRIVTGRRDDVGEGAVTGDDVAGADTAAGSFGTGGWTAAHLPEGVKRVLASYDPMDVATGAVLLLFAAVTLPAVAGAVTSGPSTVVSGLGVALFLLGVATLWLALVAAADL